MSIAYERPWYRQFWVWFVIAIPALAVIFSLQFVYIAVTHQDPVVRDDWYEDGKAVNKNFARGDAALRMGLSARIALDAETGEVALTLSAREPIQADTLTLDLVHATRQELDQRLVLHRLVDNEYRGQLVRRLDGVFQIELATPQWRLAGTRRLPAGEGFSLTAE